MKVLIQRVLEASVKVEGDYVSKIDKGMLLFICFEKNDTHQQIEQAAKKVSALRIFEDHNGKMNHNLEQAKGEVLSISQFTLSWNGKKGNRPSFDQSMEPQLAQEYYSLFNQKLREFNINVLEGVFGADMKVGLINDGPVTFFIEF